MAPMFSLLLLFLFRSQARTFRLKNIDEVNIDIKGLEILMVNYLFKTQKLSIPFGELVKVEFNEVPLKSKGVLIKLRDNTEVFIEIESASSDRYSVIPTFSSDYFLSINNQDINGNVIQEMIAFINKVKT
jgi:hypothetical protein